MITMTEQKNIRIQKVKNQPNIVCFPFMTISLVIPLLWIGDERTVLYIHYDNSLFGLEPIINQKIKLQDVFIFLFSNKNWEVDLKEKGHIPLFHVISDR